MTKPKKNFSEGEEQLIINNHVSTLARTAQNSLTPLQQEDTGEVYFISKTTPKMVREWVEELEEGSLPNRMLVSTTTYTEDKKGRKDLVFRINFMNYPFFFEGVMYGDDEEKQLSFAKNLWEQDEFMLIAFLDDGENYEVLFVKDFSFTSKASKSGIKEILED